MKRKKVKAIFSIFWMCFGVIGMLVTLVITLNSITFIKAVRIMIAIVIVALIFSGIIKFLCEWIDGFPSFKILFEGCKIKKENLEKDDNNA